MEIGDIVKVAKTLATTKSNGETIFISTNERFVVFNLMGSDAQIRSLGRTLELVIGRRFLEVQPKPKERKSLGKASFNEGKGQMLVGQVVKIGTRDLADAQEWAQNTGYHTTLNDNEHFVVTAERTKTVCIKSKERDWLMYLPKRFLEEVTPEQIKLNEQDILTLIDIAIDTGDKEWFNELHSKLSTLA